MGFDGRAADAMLKLGYRIFPFEAFTPSGNLIVPDSVDFPGSVTEGLARITTNPMWTDIYRTLSPLHRSDRVFMAGIGLVNDRVQVALVKGTATVNDPDAALNWAQGYHDTTEATVQRYAGTAYAFDPRLAAVLEKARSSLPPAQLDIVRPGSDVAVAYQGEDDPDAPPGASASLAGSAVTWLRFGLDLLVELVSKATVRTKVLTTVLWFPSQHADATFAGRWKPLHVDFQTGWMSGHRTAHLLWNPVGLPVTWRGSEVVWKGPGLDMPHEPAQWCQALSPLSNCLNRPPTLAELEELDSRPVPSSSER